MTSCWVCPNWQTTSEKHLPWWRRSNLVQSPQARQRQSFLDKSCWFPQYQQAYALCEQGARRSTTLHSWETCPSWWQVETLRTGQGCVGLLVSVMTLYYWGESEYFVCSVIEVRRTGSCWVLCWCYKPTGTYCVVHEMHEHGYDRKSARPS